jgi:phenylpropionate dioxygenase-like ring-hydroxylating dioxygenase large terminal subunit
MSNSVEPQNGALPPALQGMRESLDKGLLPVTIFNDDEIYRLERERVFGRAWCFVGHESEIPSPGDYVQRYVGEDPFVLVRGEDGRVRVLFDACRHRGALVCRSERGNAAHFRCAYHGWVYKNTGELVGAPAFKEVYSTLDRKEWGLLSAAGVDSVHGFIFATLDQEAPSLDEYLGNMRWYMDLHWGLLDDGWEVVGEPQRWIMDANWKSAAENFAGDDYHTLYLHKSMYEVGAVGVPARANMFGYHIQIGNGHNMSFSIAPDPDDPGPRFWGYPPEVVEMFRRDRVSEAQWDLARRSRVSVGTIFPNFSFLQIPLTNSPRDTEPQGLLTVRVWQPKGPGRMEPWVWFLVPKGCSEEFRTLSYRAAMGTFSSSGIYEQDDAEPWLSIARTGATAFARQVDMRLNLQMGLPGTGPVAPVPDFPGPGVAYWPRYDEGVQRSFYRRWHTFMTDSSYPPTAHATDAMEAPAPGAGEPSTRRSTHA